MLELKNVSIHHPAFSLNSVSFRVSQGEYFMILGKSGSGKSILLEAIAGLDNIHQGEILLNGKNIEKLPPQERETGIVFQDHAIFPHLTVHGNIAYALKGKNMNSSDRHQLVLEIANQMQIAGLLQRKPSTLSGGELQRVALARTLIQKPKVLLLDEPLASIDSKLKSEIRSILRKLNREGQTIVHVTHDFDEAITLAKRVVVLQEGEIIQSGSPKEVFDSPRSEFVAHFVGIENFFPVEVSRTESGCIALTSNGIRIFSNAKATSGSGFLIIRGEDICYSENKPVSAEPNRFKCRVLEKTTSRTGTDIRVDIGIPLLIKASVSLFQLSSLEEGSEAWITIGPEVVQVIPHL